MAHVKTKKLWTLDEVLSMVDRGVLPHDSRLELIRGELTEKMSPSGKKHSAVVNRIHSLLVELSGRKAIIWSQTNVELDPNSAPEPDIAVLKHRDDFYLNRLPGPEDILLLIEIADTSLAYDRKVKAALYAEAGIPEYWILDLEQQRIEQYRLPQKDGYREKAIVEKGQALPVPGLGAKITVEEMLGA